MMGIKYLNKGNLEIDGGRVNLFKMGHSSIFLFNDYPLIVNNKVKVYT